MEKDTLIIRPYHLSEAYEIAEIFTYSVQYVASQHYSAAQCEAWATCPIDYAFWSQWCTKNTPLIAAYNHHVVGFTALNKDGYIAALYTHFAYQRKGIAQQLYQTIRDQAEEKKYPRLWVHASHLASPFFQQQGFKIIEKNKVIRQQESLENFTMEINFNH